MTLQLAMLKIPVKDLAASVRFYETCLGLAPSVVVEEYGWAQFTGFSPPLALYVPGKGGGDRIPGGSVDFHLSCDRLEELADHVRRAAPEARIHENADGGRSLEFPDPDGNVLKIMERA